MPSSFFYSAFGAGLSDPSHTWSLRTAEMQKPRGTAGKFWAESVRNLIFSNIFLPQFSQFRPHSYERHRLMALRDEMRIRATIEGSEIEAYVITSFDEHLNEDVSEADKRRQYISGFTGKRADLAVSKRRYKIDQCHCPISLTAKLFVSPRIDHTLLVGFMD